MMLINDVRDVAYPHLPDWLNHPFSQRLRTGEIGCCLPEDDAFVVVGACLPDVDSDCSAVGKGEDDRPVVFSGDGGGEDGDVEGRYGGCVG